MEQGCSLVRNGLGIKKNLKYLLTKMVYRDKLHLVYCNKPYIFVSNGFFEDLRFPIKKS